MIYIVDDAADYRFLVQQVFKRFLPHYSLCLFADGLELIQSIELRSSSSLDDLTRPGLAIPGLIVLDIDMSQLNGFQTLERLKQYPLWQPIPVVMMSNRIDSEVEATAYQLGATAYLLKPIDLAGIKETMEHLCHQWLDA